MNLLIRTRSAAHRLVTRSSRRTQVIAGILAVVVAGGLVWQLTRPDSATAQTQTVEVTKGTIQQTVTGSGTIEPRKQADLDFAVSGRVTKVTVEPGDTVGKGDVLATLDTTSLDAALASAEAQLDAARTAAASDGGSSSAQQAANTASVASAEADVAQAEENLDAATLRATFAGTVADVTIEVGDQVGSSNGSDGGNGGQGGTGGNGSSDGSSYGSTAAVTVISPKTFTVEADVAADDIAKVKKGLQVTITPSGAAEPVYGTVAEVGRVAETDQSGAATFPVTVKVTGDQKGLFAGTSADVSIVVKQVKDVLTVPTPALISEDGATYVQKVDGSRTTRTRVEIGETSGATTEITSGLKEGDKVELTIPTIRRPVGGSGGIQKQGGFGGGPAGFPGGGPGLVIQGDKG